MHKDVQPGQTGPEENTFRVGNGTGVFGLGSPRAMECGDARDVLAKLASIPLEPPTGRLVAFFLDFDDLGKLLRWVAENASLRIQFCAQMLGEFLDLLQFLNHILRQHSFAHVGYV